MLTCNSPVRKAFLGQDFRLSNQFSTKMAFVVVLFLLKGHFMYETAWHIHCRYTLYKTGIKRAVKTKVENK